MKTKLLLPLAALVLAFSAQAQTTEPSLDGKYIVNLKIGDHVFADQMDLQGANGPINLRYFNGDVKGTMVVPGSFTSEIGGRAACTETSSYCGLDFFIIAHEGGQEYKVIYQAILKGEKYQDALTNPHLVLSGTAKLESGEIMGTFEAVKQ